MSRPYIQKTIVDLQQIFEVSKDNPAELKKLAAELSNRKVPKAVALAKKVADVLRGAKLEELKKDNELPPKGDPVVECQGCGQMLRIKLSAETREFSCPSCKAKFYASFSGRVLSVVFVKGSGKSEPKSDDVPLTVEDAYKLFEADESTPWEQIELARRRLIQQYHPDKVATLGQKLRAVAEAEGKRINVAYAILREDRGY
jgi:hypothetical protein